MAITLNDLWRETVDRFPDHDYLSLFGRTVTYTKVDRESRKFANFLRCQGLRPGDRVMLLMPNCPQMAIACWGIWRAGCVMTALNPLLTSSELVEMARLVEPSLFVTLKDLDAHNRALVPNLPSDCATMMVGLEAYLPPIMSVLYRLKTLVTKRNPSYQFTWSSIRDSECSSYTFEDLPKPDDLAVLQFTGGTTGSVKAAMLTHANLVANTEQAMDLVGKVIDENSVIFSAIPCFHVYGLSVCLVLAASRGAKVVMVPKFMDRNKVMKDGKEVTIATINKEVFRIFKEDCITLLPGIPNIFAALIDDKRFRDLDIEHMRLCVSGSGALNQEVKRNFQAWAGCEIIEGYGLSETSPIVSINPPGRALPGSLGIPVRDTEIRIVPEPDAKLEDGGELWVRGPQVMKGYWENEEATKDVLTPDGWLKTGDMVIQVGEHLVMTDRKKDMIKVSGENVYPSEIEKILLEKLGVAEAYVVGVPDDKSGERVVACLVPQDGTRNFSLEEVRAACGGLSKIKIPKEVWNFSKDQIPRTYLGKVQKKELRKMLTKTPS
ncbi:MAG: AMP-binding protein [bacterium]|nr:AMP-binding protein [bacterium]